MFSIMGSGAAGGIQLPPLFMKNPAGIALGFLGAIGILAQFLTIMYARYRSMQGQTRSERMHRFLELKSFNPEL